MKDELIEEEVRKLSDFGSNIQSFVDEVCETKKPLILTDSGKNKAVLLDIDNYKALREEIELLKDIRIAEEQLEKGQYISNEEAKNRLIGQDEN